MKKKVILYTILTLVILISLERIYYRQNRGFRVSKLISLQPCINETPPAEVDALLNQPFRWLGGGKTCFAFLGEDGKTVLKLFKYHQLYYKNFLFHLAFPGIADGWRMRRILSVERKQWQKRHPAFFTSCNLIYPEFKDETALVYLTLQPNLHFDREIKLIDAWGIPHHFNLSQTGFAVQKKGQLLFPYLEGLLKAEKTEEAKQVIDNLISLISLRCQKGIGDYDPHLGINFGVVDGKVVEFDLGSYYSDSSLNSPFKAARELFFSTVVLQEWLRVHSPVLLNHLMERLAHPHPGKQSDDPFGEDLHGHTGQYEASETVDDVDPSLAQHLFETGGKVEGHSKN